MAAIELKPLYLAWAEEHSPYVRLQALGEVYKALVSVYETNGNGSSTASTTYVRRAGSAWNMAATPSSGIYERSQAAVTAVRQMEKAVGLSKPTLAQYTPRMERTEKAAAAIKISLEKKYALLLEQIRHFLQVATPLVIADLGERPFSVTSDGVLIGPRAFDKIASDIASTSFRRAMVAHLPTFLKLVATDPSDGRLDGKKIVTEMARVMRRTVAGWVDMGVESPVAYPLPQVYPWTIRGSLSPSLVPELAALAATASSTQTYHKPPPPATPQRPSAFRRAWTPTQTTPKAKVKKPPPPPTPKAKASSSHWQPHTVSHPHSGATTVGGLATAIGRDKNYSLKTKSVIKRRGKLYKLANFILDSLVTSKGAGILQDDVQVWAAQQFHVTPSVPWGDVMGYSREHYGIPLKRTRQGTIEFK